MLQEARLPQTFLIDQEEIRKKIEKFLSELDEFDNRNYPGIEGHLFY